ncbi:MAG: UbiA prenyltransferase family protein [Candidatus Aureabacteria bacterium]|nr:UbiA prenyltransferase family protein [Candidatus Auribacterota bacterium]
MINMMTSVSLIPNLLSFYRVKDWIHFLGIPLLCHCKFKELNYPQLFLLVSGCALYLCFAFSINNWTDRFIDINHQNKNPFFNEIKSEKACHLFLIFLPVFPSFCSGLVISVSHFIILLFLFLFAFLYSVPPFRMKRFPIIGSAMNIFLFSPMVFLGVKNVVSYWKAAFPIALMVSFIIIIMQLYHEIEDTEDDKMAQILTTPVKFGITHTFYLITVIGLLFIFYSLFLFQIGFMGVIGLSASILYSALIFISYWLFFKKSLDSDKMRLGMRWCSIVLGISLAVEFYIN